MWVPLWRRYQDMDLTIQGFFSRPLLQNWNQWYVPKSSSFCLAAQQTETKKVLCRCATHSFLFVQWNEHAWRALIKSSPGTMTLSTCLLNFNNVCSVLLFKSDRSFWALRAFTYYPSFRNLHVMSMLTIDVL